MKNVFFFNPDNISVSNDEIVAIKEAVFAATNVYFQSLRQIKDAHLGGLKFYIEYHPMRGMTVLINSNIKNKCSVELWEQSLL